MSRMQAGIAAASVVLAVSAALAARDLHGWDEALTRNEPYNALLPGDPVGSALGADDVIRYRTALRGFTAALRTPRGFDNGERRARARSAAEALLAEAATAASPARAAQAQNLLGVLASSGGRVARGVTGEDRARNAFEIAIRVDPRNVDAKYNLELLLRRQRPAGTRVGPASGSGPRGPSQRGAGSGTPGRGY